jgi:ankyrin repeat protein
MSTEPMQTTTATALLAKDDDHPLAAAGNGDKQQHSPATDQSNHQKNDDNDKVSINNDIQMDVSPAEKTTSQRCVDSPGSTTENPVDKHRSEHVVRPPATSTNQKQTKKKKKKTVIRINPEIHINERDDDENTALHIAIHARKLEHVQLLLEAGASVRMRSDGSLPIHTAISIGALREYMQFAYECVLLLHEHGADLTVKDDSIHTPLFLACMFNLPQIASYILSDEEGVLTLNARADRAGNRPLHACAKFDTLDNPSVGKPSAPMIVMGQANHEMHHHHHHHPQQQQQQHNSTRSTIQAVDPENAENSPKPMTEHLSSSASDHEVTIPHSTEALLTQVLLGTKGIEIDSLNVLGQTPLHIACMRKNWSVARLLLKAGADPNVRDRRGYTPGQLARKRAMPIPLDLMSLLVGGAEPPGKGILPPARDLIVDPDARTLLICHEICSRHHTCPPITRDSPEPPPENIRRLHVLIDAETGILRTGEFGTMVWNMEARRASMVDVLKVCTGSLCTKPNPALHHERKYNLYFLAGARVLVCGTSQCHCIVDSG